MWMRALVLCHLLIAADLQSSNSQNCSLTCLRQGGPGCDYCRINSDEVDEVIGLKHKGCIPWPCFQLLEEEDPRLCQHFVQAPHDINIESVPSSDPNLDSVVVSWKPSQYGIEFLRGFQVSMQSLGGSGLACQLFLFQRKLTLSASHAQKVYKSDMFSGLSLGSDYAVTVMALPVPEKWEKFYHSKIFSTRSCEEKNGFLQCKADWYPKYVDVQQKEGVVTVTFNLAPPTMGITSYFCICTADSKTTSRDIIPNLSGNQTHHSFALEDLGEGSNYTCEIAANQVDAVRKVFYVKKQESTTEHHNFPYWTLAFLFVFAAAIIFVVILVIRMRKRYTQTKKLIIGPEIMIKQHEEEAAKKEEIVPLCGNRKNPPTLLICYSRCDGPAHMDAVMKLASFIQQHMATKVSLDRWDSLEMSKEGQMSWYCRHIRDSDFILVVCSGGLLRQRPQPSPQGVPTNMSEMSCEASSHSKVMVSLMGEEVGRAISGGEDLSKYMTAIFDYSDEKDVPTELRPVVRYKLPADLPLLFSRLHQVPLHSPGRYVSIKCISEEEFTEMPAGQALQQAISAAAKAMTELQHKQDIRLKIPE
ncbi:interleukin-17 receptor D-like isoform X2 [Nerophis ophidion]|uniref:interleukin-17 receptor D-like isoform X2 n=1 Tax=Nerophis ophidion TaxID=159077 RepID=UPI002ADFB019|nr:interleukin-17 receptor D-like isoform X2 [Nerophis ophidion]